MNQPNLFETLTALFPGKQIRKSHVIQALWSGYGELARYYIDNEPVILKHIDLQAYASGCIVHPRGWSSTFSHQRKIASYQNERQFYCDYAHLTDHHCRVPRLLSSRSDNDGLWLLLEDLDAAGFDQRHGLHLTKSVTPQQRIKHVRDVIRWLAYFHGRFIQPQQTSLWPQGNYWHLATRPDEFNAMPDSPLKEAAHELDKRLRACQYQTIIHGDAKLANFCFHQAPDHDPNIAAVDFQYCGTGVGIIDVVYLLGSAFDSDELTRYSEGLIAEYFDHLTIAIGASLSEHQLSELRQQWGQLVCVAWADFERFLVGWSPQHAKRNAFSDEQTNLAIY